MGNPELIGQLVEQGQALAQAVEALRITEMNSPFERVIADLLRAAYERRLLEILETAPDIRDIIQTPVRA
jgi:hypothetical protein